MIHAPNSRSILALAATISLGAYQAEAVTYKATLIGPMGYTDTTAVGISGSSVVGLGNPTTPEALGAFLLNRATNMVVELTPSDWATQPNGVSGEYQVGHGTGPTTGFATHALLWNGTAESLVDLNPIGFSTSYAQGIYGNTQVGSGWGDATATPSGGQPSHALLWHGTPDSVVDLHPAGYVSSQANAVFEDNVVGIGTKPSLSLFHALLWHGTADSVVDLHPAEYPQSFASDVWQDSQVGTGVFSSAPGGERHALLWHGTAASVIDLHSSGFTQTGANAVAGNLQVGFGVGAATGGQQHALLWESTAASVVDLHSALAGLGPSFVHSFAYDIDESGVIVGSAGDANNSYAVMWSPVPEPAGMTLLVVGLVTAHAAYRRCKPARACKHWSRTFALAGAIISACGTLHASIITSGNLVIVSSDRALRSYTFAGDLMETLPISGLPISGISASPEGVAVIGDRLFVGLVSSSALYAPKIVELNPTTGAVIALLDTIAPHLTALGDDGANLLLLDSVPTTPWQVYTYNTSGALVNQHNVDRHFPLNFQGEGIDSDGPSIFMSGQIAPYPGQPVITNTAAGAYVSDFNTNMLPLVSFIGGLAYDRSDDTLWIAGNSEFRQFTRAGVLLSVVNTGNGNTGVTGLEVISRAVPEPTAIVVWSALGGFVFAIVRPQRMDMRRGDSDRPCGRRRISARQLNHLASLEFGGASGGNVGGANATRLQYATTHFHLLDPTHLGACVALVAVALL